MSAAIESANTFRTSAKLDWANVTTSLRALPDGCAQATIIDDGAPFEEIGLIAKQCRRLMANRGALIIFCPQAKVFDVHLQVRAAGYNFQGFLVWDKKKHKGETGFASQHEIGLHFSTGDPDYQPLYETGVSDVLAVSPPGRGRSLWPQSSQLPVPLLQDLMKVVTQSGDTVLNPHCSGGNVGVAAALMGVNSILIADNLASMAEASEHLERLSCVDVTEISNGEP